MTALSAHRRTKLVLFATALVAYVLVGYWLQVQNGYILGDSLSRRLGGAIGAL